MYTLAFIILASEPKILDFQPEVHASEGEQVTLRVNFTGIPKPTITWKFKGTKMEGDYATELGTDGSLLFVCVEKKHAGRYRVQIVRILATQLVSLINKHIIKIVTDRYSLCVVCYSLNWRVSSCV